MAADDADATAVVVVVAIFALNFKPPISNTLYSNISGTIFQAYIGIGSLRSVAN